MAETLNVLVAGAAGRMGREVVKAVSEADGMDLCALVDPGHAGQNLMGLPVEDTLPGALKRARPDVMVDFTRPDVVMDNLRAALGAGVAAVVGTTGLSAAHLERIRGLCADGGAACLVAPNFAIGAVLMMQFARMAARFMPDCEIIEMHHNQKLDAPSGTAANTARLVAAARAEAAPDKTEKVTAEGARGGDVDGVKVHSVRLPGFVASQAVIFGGPGQTLTIRHDSMDRASFMPGVVLAVRRIRSTSGLTVGLEQLLDL